MTITGTLRHRYNDSLVRSYCFSSAVAGDTLDIAGTGSVLPPPMAAVAWDVTYSTDSER